MPSSLEGWLKFTLAVGVASIVLATVARRVTPVAQILQGF